jgi:hypothetical protein
MEFRTYENRHSDMDVRVAVARGCRREFNGALGRSTGARSLQPKGEWTRINYYH